MLCLRKTCEVLSSSSLRVLILFNVASCLIVQNALDLFALSPQTPRTVCVSFQHDIKQDNEKLRNKMSKIKEKNKWKPRQTINLEKHSRLALLILSSIHLLWFFLFFKTICPFVKLLCLLFRSASLPS